MGCVAVHAGIGAAHANAPVQQLATVSTVKHASVPTQRQLPALHVRGGPTMG